MSLTTATDELRGRFGAEVILPDDPEYDEARALHNAMIDKRPAVIMRCGSAADIVGALEFARMSPHLRSPSAAVGTTVLVSVRLRAVWSSTCRR